ncbi:hypothetical protein MTO96_052050 [Rhipicephalus appendiculatus]
MLIRFRDGGAGSWSQRSRERLPPSRLPILLRAPTGRPKVDIEAATACERILNAADEPKIPMAGEWGIGTGLVYTPE